MLEIILNDGSAYEALNETTVFPSLSSVIRSYMEIHLPESAMSMETLERLLNDEELTKRITLKKTDENGNVLFEDVYLNFVFNAEIGKKTVEKVDVATGAVTSEKHLVARQEQLTLIEQKLHELGLL